MDVLEFPSEILHVILVHAVLSRGVKRGLRLRLVCKVFACMVHPALFETLLMDDKRAWPYGGVQWQRCHQHGSFELWTRYLVFRSLHEQNPAVKRFVEIRYLAKAIYREAAVLDVTAIVEALCWLASSHGANTACNDEEDKWGPLTAEKQRPEPDLGLNMLTAAAYLNILPLAERLLAEGHQRPTSHNYLFAPPIQVAAQAGNIEMLRLLQGCLPGSEFELWSVKGAAMKGDIAILKAALRIGQGDNSEGFVIMNGKPYGSIDHTTEIGKGILLARENTSNPEVYEYLTSALAPWPEAMEVSHRDLAINAGLGNLAMVRHLLDLGVPVQQPVAYDSAAPLVMAARYTHNDVAELLLEHGADPNYVTDAWYPMLPLHEAATSSNLSLTRTLLRSGALTSRPAACFRRWPALYWAFAREHENMVGLLLEHGADFNGISDPSKSGGVTWSEPEGWIGERLAVMTYHLGWTSMAKLLREHGFQVTEPCPLPRWHAGYWTNWDEARALYGR